MKLYTFLVLCLVAGIAALVGVPLHPEAGLALFALGATAFKATNYSATGPKFAPEGYECGQVSRTFSLAAAFVINDTVDFMDIPKGARINRVELVSDDLDTNVTPLITLNLGLKNGTGTEFFSASTVGQAGGRVLSAAHPLDMTADDTIRMLVKAAPATGALTGNVSVIADYTMPSF